MFILSSSGFGKSLLPFSLVEFPIIYFSADLNTDAAHQQAIYGYFQELKDLFFECLLQDLVAICPSYENTISRENLCENEVYKTFSTDIISVCSIRKTLKKSFVVGLLLQIINQANKRNWRGIIDPALLTLDPIEAISVSAFRNFTIDSLPLVFLDEFYTKNTLHLFHITFLRNLLRTFQFRVIIAGTNSNAANLINTGTGASRSDGAAPWVYIWTKLPNYTNSCWLELEKPKEARIRLVSLSSRTSVRFMLETILDVIKTERPLVIFFS